MLNNQQRREILNAAKATGHQGSVLDLFAQAEAGVDVPTLLHAEQDAKRQMEAQQMQVARTQQEQQVGLREEHAGGNTGASMAFPDVAPNASFNTEGMKVPINISKFDQQGHLVQSFKDVPPGVQNLPTGPGRGTVIETPAYKYGGYKQKYQNAGFLTQRYSGFPLYRDLLTGETTASPQHGNYARAYEGGQPATGYYPGIPLGLGEAEVATGKGKYSEAQQAKMQELMNNPDLTEDEIYAQVGAPEGQSVFNNVISGLDSIEGAVGKTGGGILGQYDPTDPGMKKLQDKMNKGRDTVAMGLSPFMAIPALSIAGPMLVEAGISGIPSLTRTATQAPRYFGNKFLTHTGQAITGVEGGFGSYLGGLRSGQMTTQGLTQLSNLQRAKSGLMSTYYTKSLLGIPGAYNKMYEGASAEFAGKGDLGTRSRFVEGFADVLPYTKGAGFLRNEALGRATPLEVTKFGDAFSRGDWTEVGARTLALGLKGDQSKTVDQGSDFASTAISTGRKYGLFDKAGEAAGDLASGATDYVADLFDTYQNIGTGKQGYQDFITGQETERVNPGSQRMGGPRMYQNGGPVDTDPVEDYVRRYLNDKFNIDYDKLLDNQKQELRRRAMQDARYLEQTKTRPDLYPELNFNKS